MSQVLTETRSVSCAGSLVHRRERLDAAQIVFSYLTENSPVEIIQGAGVVSGVCVCVSVCVYFFFYGGCL